MLGATVCIAIIASHTQTKRDFIATVIMTLKVVNTSDARNTKERMNDMKTSIWKRFFRCGWNRKSAIDNGWWAKHDAKTTRTKLNRKLDKLLKDKEE